MSEDSIHGTADHGTGWEARLTRTYRRLADGAPPKTEMHWAVTAGDGVITRIEVDRLAADTPRERVIEVVNEQLRHTRPGL